jgi:hypothetical protein
LVLSERRVAKFPVAVLIASVLALAVGCSSSNKHAASSHGSGHGDMAASASGDECSHCQGVQKANADGKCPVCGMQLK